MNPKVTIKGTKKDGYVLTLVNKGDKFKFDVALTYEELETILKAIKKIIK